MSGNHQKKHHVDDALLLFAVRMGDRRAYGELFQRYAETARQVARRWTSQPDEQQDLVAAAFTQTLNAIRNGAGPYENLLPYLMTAVRRLGMTSLRHRIQAPLYGTEPHVNAATRDGGAAAVDERMLRRWNIQLACSAFRALPPRWRLVLWYTEVECLSPAELAPRLGLSPNGVAALAMRAREGLRREYLQTQVPKSRAVGCAAIRRHLGAWTRHSLSTRRKRLIMDHLAACQDCRDVAAMLTEINRELLSRASCDA